MGDTNIAVIFIGTVIYFSTFSTAMKTHDILLTKVDKAQIDQDFLEDYNMNLKKIGKRAKELTVGLNLKQEVGPDIMCEVKIFQKSGGNYVKSPVEIQRKPCCKFIEENTLIWPCLRRRSSFPEKCPIPKGAHWIKNYNPDACNYTENLPPKLPEDYKAELHISRGAKQKFQQTFYGNLKRIMKFF